MADFHELYCCACERLTTHREVTGSEAAPFDLGLECMVCHTVWEAEEPEPEKPLSRHERHQRAADAGFDTREDYNGDK